MNVQLFGKVDSTCIANWALRKSGEDSIEDVKCVLNTKDYMVNVEWKGINKCHMKICICYEVSFFWSEKFAPNT